MLMFRIKSDADPHGLIDFYYKYSIAVYDMADGEKADSRGGWGGGEIGVEDGWGGV